MNEQDLEYQEAKNMKLDGEAMTRLYNNRDFKRLFTSTDRGFLKAGALELVSLIAQPNLPPGMVDENNKRLYAMSFVEMYLANLVTLGHDAANALNNEEED